MENEELWDELEIDSNGNVVTVYGPVALVAFISIIAPRFGGVQFYGHNSWFTNIHYQTDYYGNLHDCDNPDNPLQPQLLKPARAVKIRIYKGE